MNSTIERVDDALAGGPVVSMRVVTAEEDVVFPDFSDGLKPELRTEMGRIYASLGTELGLIRDLVGTAKESLNVEDYGDALAGAFARLSVCIGRLGDLETAAPETGRRGDLEALRAECDHLRADNVKLRMLLGIKEAAVGFHEFSSLLKVCASKIEEFSEKLAVSTKGGAA